jgi:hypothetical protein
MHTPRQCRQCMPSRTPLTSQMTSKWRIAAWSGPVEATGRESTHQLHCPPERGHRRSRGRSQWTLPCRVRGRRWVSCNCAGGLAGKVQGAGCLGLTYHCPSTSSTDTSSASGPSGSTMNNFALLWMAKYSSITLLRKAPRRDRVAGACSAAPRTPDEELPPAASACTCLRVVFLLYSTHSVHWAGQEAVAFGHWCKPTLAQHHAEATYLAISRCKSVCSSRVPVKRLCTWSLV